VTPSQVTAFSARPPSAHNTTHENAVSTRGVKRQRNGGDCMRRAYMHPKWKTMLHATRTILTDLTACSHTTESTAAAPTESMGGGQAENKLECHNGFGNNCNADEGCVRADHITSHRSSDMRALPCVTCTQRSLVATDRRQHSTRQRATIKMMQFASLFSVSARLCTQCHLTATLATRAHRALTAAPKRRTRGECRDRCLIHTGGMRHCAGCKRH
jgi:hypothetical protein